MRNLAVIDHLHYNEAFPKLSSCMAVDSDSECVYSYTSHGIVVFDMQSGKVSTLFSITKLCKFVSPAKKLSRQLQLFVS